MTDRAIRSIAIVGGGIVGLSAALAFRQSLPAASVTIVEISEDPAALADRLPAAWPSIGQFHALIGLDELDLLRRGIAVHHVGTMFENWPAGRDWVHGFGPHGKPVGAVHFDQIWMRAVKEGPGGPYESYSAADVLTLAGKFVHPSRDPTSLLGTFQYGLKLDPGMYRELLRERAASAGVHVVSGALQSVETSAAGKIGCVSLANGERIEADLFIDCGGPSGLLIGEVDESFESSSAQPVCVAIESGPSEGPSPVARVFANEGGWTGEWPLRDRTMRCVAGGRDGIAIHPGRRTRAWAGNVLALGDAAVAVEPLYGLNLALAHRAIFLALELLPTRNFYPVELAEFNRRWLLITDQVRDLTALLRGDGTSFPESLARRIDQYEHRGRLPYQEEAVLNRDDWTSALIGMGIVPHNVDRTAASVPLDRAAAAMSGIARELAEFAAQAPAYPDYLARITGGR